MIYRLLKRAVLSGHVRITWRPRFKLLVDDATETKSKSTACVIRRQLLLSLIFGDVRDVPAYKPLDAPFGYAYDFTSTVLEVLCIPKCFQNIRVSHIPGYSLPVRGPAACSEILILLGGQFADRCLQERLSACNTPPRP